MRVLVVEDERKVAEALRDGLEAEQYDVALEHTGAGAFYRTATEAFDLVILDLTLPDRDGLDILAAIREHRINVPVLVLSARGSVQDREHGLEAGADDYVIKPFAFAELLARMRALVRRGSMVDVRRLTVGPLSLDVLSRRVTREGQPIDVTIKEFDVLAYLMRHEGEVVSRETLTREVWNEDTRTTPLDNVIDVHMARLRRKIDADGAPSLIHTVRGVGFMLRDGEA